MANRHSAIVSCPTTSRRLAKRRPSVSASWPLPARSASEELFEAWAAQVNHFVDIKHRGNQIFEQIYATTMPAPFLSIITDDCIKNGKDYHAGGAR